MSQVLKLVEPRGPGAQMPNLELSQVLGPSKEVKNAFFNLLGPSKNFLPHLGPNPEAIEMMDWSVLKLVEPRDPRAQLSVQLVKPSGTCMCVCPATATPFYSTPAGLEPMVLTFLSSLSHYILHHVHFTAIAGRQQLC